MPVRSKKPALHKTMSYHAPVRKAEKALDVARSRMTKHLLNDLQELFKSFGTRYDNFKSFIWHQTWFCARDQSLNPSNYALYISMDQFWINGHPCELNRMTDIPKADAEMVAAISKEMQSIYPLIEATPSLKTAFNDLFPAPEGEDDVFVAFFSDGSYKTIESHKTLEPGWASKVRQPRKKG